MLDPKFIRQNVDLVRQAIANKGEKADPGRFIEADDRRREIIGTVEKLKAERNAASNEISKIKKAGGDATDMIEKMRTVGDNIAALDKELLVVEESIKEILLWIPNIPHQTVPVGATDADNLEVRRWGDCRQFDFQPRPHWEIGEMIGGLDIRGGAKVSGSGFYFLTGPGASLERALINFMLDLHTSQHGYTEVLIPYLVGSDAMRGTGQIPKLAEDMYYLDKDDLYLIPTAEVSLTNIHAGEILQPDKLPVKFVAFSPCFRREAGSYGKETRGIVRVHQFHKVEMVKIVEPETSYNELESLVANAETVLQRLQLPYRVRLLCTGDLSFAAAKCYDLEVHAPGMNTWLEVSSCSNFEDFQARRMNLRFRPEKGGKTAFPHTLNGSGLALPRTVASILENYQTRSGEVTVPEVLRPYMGGIETLKG
ncbi:MAG: serine--tRNA ligase [candidate division Zixibacteria bacterium RBG_16_53_22]|nr:MAG: serine--tRNA ligase [candidate division Zixibacteria bacterium RBG_16_53_22]